MWTGKDWHHDRRGAMTTDLLERGGSFGHLEEPDAVLEHLWNFWMQLKS